MTRQTVSAKPCISKIFCALGTINQLRLYDYDMADENPIEPAIQRIYEIESRMSAFRQESEISLLSRNAGKQFVYLHPETFRLLEKAVRYSELSEGAFDVTVRPLVELWGIGRKGDFIPDTEEIEAARRLVGYRSLLFNRRNYCAAFRKEGQAVDLGGIAKGYAADETAGLLKENGVKSALLNLGGNIVALGCAPDGGPWKIGIQNPLESTGKFLGVLSLRNQSAVTSAVNERFFIKDGVRYHHLLDPRTGFPAQNGLLSVTVVCPSAADADAASTAFFVLGPEKGLNLLQKLNAGAVFVTDDRKIFVTENLAGRFRITAGDPERGAENE